MSTPKDADQDPVGELRRQMAQIRRELHEDVQGLVAGAEEAGDWRHYVKIYPWAALGLSAAVGYFVVPKRHRTADQVAEEAVEHTAARLRNLERAVKKRPLISIGGKAPAKEKEQEKEEEKEKKSGVLGMLFGMVGPIALKAAQNYGTHFVQNWLAQQQAQQSEAGPDPRSASGPTSTRPRPGGPGSMPPPDLPPPSARRGPRPG